MKCLITGGAGFIGSHLSERLLASGFEIVGLDSFNDYYDPRLKRANVEPLIGKRGYTLAEMDILDFESLQKRFEQRKLDVLVQLASRASVRPSIAQPHLYEKVNMEGTLNLLELTRRHGIEKFIFASSSSVYGENLKVP